MTGGEYDQVVAERLERAHGLAVGHPRRGEQSREVVLRVGASILDDAVEQLVELEPQLRESFGAVFSLALQIGVVPRKQLLGQFEDAFLVGLVDPEERCEHAQRVALRDPLDEVAFALITERVDQAASALGHDLVEALDAAGSEEPTCDFAEIAVFRRVHLDDRAHLSQGRIAAVVYRVLLYAVQYSDPRHVAERLGFARDIHDVGVLRDRPEIVELATVLAAVDR